MRPKPLGILLSRILSQWDPADKAAFETTGRLLGTDRVLGGIHYPSDAQTACGEWRR